VVEPERQERGAPADCWNWGKWGLREYIMLKGSYLGWFVGIVVPVQEIFVLPWLRISPVHIIFLAVHYVT
jgi:hypothetical protein